MKVRQCGVPACFIISPSSGCELHCHWPFFGTDECFIVRWYVDDTWPICFYMNINIELFHICRGCVRTFPRAAAGARAPRDVLHTNSGGVRAWGERTRSATAQGISRESERLRKGYADAMRTLLFIRSKPHIVRHIAGLRRGTRATYMDYRNVCGTGWKCVLRLFLRLPVGCARLV